MNKIIVYASRYGTSKHYAFKIAEQKKYPICSLDEFVDHKKQYNELIFIAPVYMGKVWGLDKLIRRLDHDDQVELTLLTVGIYNPKRGANHSKIQKKINKISKKEPFKLQSLYHLRGQLKLNKLSITHKLLIKALYKNAKKQKPQALSKDERDIIKAYEHSKQADDTEFSEILARI
ncbi:hypothetical protein JCM15457_2053 [Liquorilactobacillus sucicola DSM 21376 = JCM 15457]|uniref:Flavodoxin domain-containing protein n=1 Tax=Liquorilactobacillus sucicola DSM 21376 = JCM 15457 TaxID=1423806 RepID=A0A023CZT1_9LACO|nr:flavodoxin domain-containing protein [Liquorilactobacillus sucicola]KRN06651.1 hypothetical protein FD15_GL000201 [Liquorilactobacillus sucicola DSM 21376 = JCM 15457]GAJ27091.1 hypothetical protein JCM15457_2053 [Liquorilactobacillus sucicola DSM 21376 = JCM 15457]